MSDEKNTQAPEATAPRTLQVVQRELSQSLYDLGCARYDLMMAQEKEAASIQRSKDLAKETNELRKKIEKAAMEAAEKAGGSKPQLSAVDGGKGGSTP